MGSEWAWYLFWRSLGEVAFYILSGFLPLAAQMSPGALPSTALPTLSSHSAAKSKPIIAEPEIHGAQPLDGVTGFLVLMSEGLYKALEAAHGPGQANQVSPAPAEHRQPTRSAVHPPGDPASPRARSMARRDLELQFANVLTRQLLRLQSSQEEMPALQEHTPHPEACLFWA